MNFQEKGQYLIKRHKMSVVTYVLQGEYYMKHFKEGLQKARDATY